MERCNWSTNQCLQTLNETSTMCLPMAFESLSAVWKCSLSKEKFRKFYVEIEFRNKFPTWKLGASYKYIVLFMDTCWWNCRLNLFEDNEGQDLWCSDGETSRFDAVPGGGLRRRNSRRHRTWAGRVERTSTGAAQSYRRTTRIMRYIYVIIYLL